MKRGTTIAAALIGLIAGALVMWLVTRGGGPADRAGTERIVRDYLLAHPEVLPEAMQRLHDKESGKVIQAERAAIETPFGSAWAGNPKGDVTVVEYLDYACGYCRASLPLVAALIAADPNVRVVYRDLPVLSEESRAAARMAIAAAEQGKFAAFHDALYAGGALSPSTIESASRQAGVDPARAAALAPRADGMIRDNMSLAGRLGMNGTPSWVVGDRVLIGMVALEELQKAVAAARAAAR